MDTGIVIAHQVNIIHHFFVTVLSFFLTEYYLFMKVDNEGWQGASVGKAL